MTYAELCAEVSGLLEIAATDYDRMNVAKSVNRSIKHMLNRLPVMFIPQNVKGKLMDFETSGLMEVPIDFIRAEKVNVVYVGAVAAVTPGVPCEYLHPNEWPPGRNLNHTPTQEYPLFSHLADNLGTEATLKLGFIAVLPAPAAKLTKGMLLRYVGFSDPVDAGHDVPLGPHLHGLLVNKTCEYVCMVENYDLPRAATFKLQFDDELTGILGVGQ